jgi:hypothetical protein
MALGGTGGTGGSVSQPLPGGGGNATVHVTVSIEGTQASFSPLSITVPRMLSKKVATLHMTEQIALWLRKGGTLAKVADALK